MIKRMLPVVLLLSACDGQTQNETNGERSISSYLTRDPIKSGTTIIEWQAIDDTHVFVLDSSHTLSYGDGINWQTVHASVNGFAAAAESPTIWLRDNQGNLYPWQLGWPQSQAEQPIASNVGEFKVSSDGTPYWIANGYLYGGWNRAPLDTNVAQFYPANSEWVFILGTDGKLWSWGYGSSWSRSFVDANVISAQPGCFYTKPDGQCHSFVLGSDRKLWVEGNSFPAQQQPPPYTTHGANPVDANVLTFDGGRGNGNIVFVEGLDRNLWREDGDYTHRDNVDGNVYRFQPTSNTTVWVQGYDGKLWREHLSSSLPSHDPTHLALRSGL